MDYTCQVSIEFINVSAFHSWTRVMRPVLYEGFSNSRIGGSSAGVSWGTYSSDCETEPTFTKFVGRFPPLSHVNSMVSPAFWFYDINPPKCIAQHLTEGKYLPDWNADRVRARLRSRSVIKSIRTVVASEKPAVWLVEIVTWCWRAGVCLCPQSTTVLLLISPWRGTSYHISKDRDCFFAFLHFSGTYFSQAAFFHFSLFLAYEMYIDQDR